VKIVRSRRRSCALSVRMTISTECILAAPLRLNFMWAITEINVPATEFTLPKTVFRAPDGSQSTPRVCKSVLRAEFLFL